MGKKSASLIIRARSLVKRFDGFTAVDSISFAVRKGELFAFLGPNGAGKTTTIKMLTTLLHPTSGMLSVNGFDPVDEQKRVRESFGIVFQDPSLDDELTAYENLEFHSILYRIPKHLREKKIGTMLQFVQLCERKNDLVKTFSGGMKRRLEIARALLHSPPLLFLDEPTLGLDPQTRNHLWEYLRKLNSKEHTTVFFTTHYMEEAENYADRVAIIDRGKIVDSGTPAALMKKTATTSLEKAFLKLTGHLLRDESSSGAERMRTIKRIWGR